MTRTPLLLALASAALLAVPAVAAPAANVEMKAPDGKAMGTAVIEEGPAGVLLRLDLTGLTPGWHGVHLHETGACTDAKFTSAGAHINHAPAKKPHGFLNPDGPDFGDLPNIYVGADGTVKAELFSTFVSTRGTSGRPALLDANGSSLLVHAKADDHTTQPIGGAGDRVACGVVKAASMAATAAESSAKPAPARNPGEAAAAQK
jgi:superoxide dismutase, Cu-Zn family